MAKRFPRQTARSYRTDQWTPLGTLKYRITTDEIRRHVAGTCRCDADPIFNDLAHIAAMNGLRHGHTGGEGVSFTQPTTKPRGYFSVLKFIIANPCITKGEIDAHFGVTLLTTVDRLLAGGLVEIQQLRSKKTNRVCSHFTATALGKNYATAAARYVVKRH